MIFAMCAFAFAFASCEQNGGLDLPKGEIEQSYVAISLASADAPTRATTEGLDEGTEAERAVKSAYVFFYKDGVPFPVNEAANAAGGADDKNYLSISLDENGADPSDNATTNISDVKNKVLVLNNYKGQYPNQVIAVLNFNPTSVEDIHTKTITDLQETLVGLGNDTNGYVMSNSVYADATGEVVATPLAAANIATSSADAIANPVKIYVERVAAKVVVGTNAGSKDGYTAQDNANVYKLGNGLINGVGDQVYAKVLAWEVVNYSQSYLYKDIDASWTDGVLKFSWNDLANYRSYWATTQSAALPTVVLDNVTSLAAKYTGENTNAVEGKYAELVIKAQLQKADGTPCELAKWYGYEYVGRDNLKQAVINNIASTYYYKANETTYTTIGTADIETVGYSTTAPDGVDAYEVYFQLSTDGAGKTWYVRNNGEFVAVGNAAAMNAKLAEILPALLYAEGYTYYHTPIVHRATAENTVYGVVRNHVYNVNIKSIHGYGTPISVGNLSVTPVTPEEISSYVAAEINVLSWKTVTYEVDL